MRFVVVAGRPPRTQPVRWFAPFAGGRREPPARTVPKAPERFVGSLARTSGAGSRIPGTGRASSWKVLSICQRLLTNQRISSPSPRRGRCIGGLECRTVLAGCKSTPGARVRRATPWSARAPFRRPLPRCASPYRTCLPRQLEAQITLSDRKGRSTTTLEVHRPTATSLTPL